MCDPLRGFLPLSLGPFMLVREFEDVLVSQQVDLSVKKGNHSLSELHRTSRRGADSPAWLMDALYLPELKLQFRSIGEEDVVCRESMWMSQAMYAKCNWLSIKQEKETLQSPLTYNLRNYGSGCQGIRRTLTNCVLQRQGVKFSLNGRIFCDQEIQ